jgi:acyl carrier protein
VWREGLPVFRFSIFVSFNNEFLMPEIKSFIKNFLKESLFISVADEDESLIKSRTLDSITVVDLAVAIEEEYKIKVPFTDITEDNFDTINKMVEFLQTKGLKA